MRLVVEAVYAVTWRELMIVMVAAAALVAGTVEWIDARRVRKDAEAWGRYTRGAR